MCAVKFGDIFNWLLLVVSLQFSLVSPVKINELRVPAVTRHGTAVILDCDYTLDGPTDGLVVKWYLNDQSRPVYVWIPGESGPKGLGVLRGRLNLDYRVNEDAKMEHRALHIVASARDLAGEYTCVVSTFLNEDRKTKYMLVFEPEKSLRLNCRRTEWGVMEAVCSAEGMYPEPEMTIRVTYQHITRDFEGGAVLHRQRDGLYDVSLAAPLSLSKEDLIQSRVEVSCELTIPAANYTVHKEMLYCSGTGRQCEQYTWVVLTTYGIVKYLLNF